MGLIQFALNTLPVGMEQAPLLPLGNTGLTEREEVEWGEVGCSA